MSDSLVERLRALAEHQDALGGAGYVLPKQRAMLRAAADQIEADAARIKELETLIEAFEEFRSEIMTTIGEFGRPR